MSETSVGMIMASLPGRTVWQNDTMLPALFTALTAPVPSTQYGVLSNGFSGFPPLQYSPPYWNDRSISQSEIPRQIGAPTIDSGYVYVVFGFHCAISLPDTQASGHHFPSSQGSSGLMAKPLLSAPGTCTRSGSSGKLQVAFLATLGAPITSLAWPCTCPCLFAYWACACRWPRFAATGPAEKRIEAEPMTAWNVESLIASGDGTIRSKYRWILGGLCRTRKRWIAPLKPVQASISFADLMSERVDRFSYARWTSCIEYVHTGKRASSQAAGTDVKTSVEREQNERTS